MIFRSEQVRDYHAIANLNYNAFLGWRSEDLYIHEPDMVALARQSAMFDPELSIVAVDNNEIVGHILLMPAMFIVEGKIAKGTILGPVAVSPELQKKGIGKSLIEHAHEKAKEKGFEFSLLCGHPEYYPKLGYITNVFSVDGVKIKRVDSKIVAKGTSLTARPLRESDIEAVDNWQNNIRANDNMAIMFEKDIMGYHAYSKIKTSAVLESNNKPVAFIKYDTTTLSKIDFVYYEDNYLAEVLDYLFEMTGEDDITISQPPSHFMRAENLNGYSVEDARSTCDAFMIYPFDDKGIVNDYIIKVKSDKSLLGVIYFPPYVWVD